MRDGHPHDAQVDERSDIELVAAWRAGDADASDALLGRHFRSVFAFFRSKVPDVASDLAQQTFLACIESLPRFDPERVFRAYLFGIARKLLMRHLRALGSDAARLTDLGEKSIAEITRSPSRVAALAADTSRLLEAMQQLPLDFQIALELRYWEELAVGDIAMVLDVPEGTVRSRLTRARQQLRGLLGADDDQLAALGRELAGDQRKEPAG
jgi:RNA polymerase sigma factor (sigma-70 family)